MPPAANELEQARRNAGVHTARLEEGATAYQVEGSTGPWVVLVHGLLTPMFAWEPLSTLLSEHGYRVLRYDQFGRGLSDRPALRYDPALYTRQLTQLTEQLGITCMHLVSWSMGGVIASRFALEQPTRVASLTLIAPALFLQPPRKLRLLLPFALGRRLIARNMRGPIASLAHQHLAFPERFPDYQARMSEQLAFPGLGESFVSTLQHFAWNAGHDWTSLGAHPRRTLVIWGDQDQTTPYANAAPVAKLFPRAQQLRVAGARHGVHLDHQDIVYPALLAHLAASDASGAVQ